MKYSFAQFGTLPKSARQKVLRRSALVALCLAPLSALHAQALGPLRVHPTNPRYFTDGTKNADGTLRAVYLTGAHTWANLVDIGKGDPPPAFDYEAYLDFLERHHHNFFRLWREEAVLFLDERFVVTPHPWQRNGPGDALDGRPKFDLTKFNDSYFERLRSRVQAAGKRGIYVSVMLFEGWVLQQKKEEWWRDHPFHPDNNINAINGDANGDGRGIEVHTLEQPAVTKVQEAYVRRVLDAVGDFDNVLWEIANETGIYSTEWQYHFIRFIKAEEAKRPKQHPVGMTFQYNPSTKLRGTNHILFDSPADWISPNKLAADGYDYKFNPPPADGRKVIVPDTDHLGGIWGNSTWVWKSFTRGLNPIFMDPYDNQIIGEGSPSTWDAVRASLGHTRRLAERVNLAAMLPDVKRASTGYCLAEPGVSCIVFAPGGGDIEVDLTDSKATSDVEWLEVATGKITKTGAVAGGAKQKFRAAFQGAAVLFLHAQDAAR
ncbi:MAG: hypothetical protein K1X78_03100 [Verrucomicrobiaceae bacterium]|nr:hypothetical protein [Verrucomicrobiaceae bacterium]